MPLDPRTQFPNSPQLPAGYNVNGGGSLMCFYVGTQFRLDCRTYSLLNSIDIYSTCRESEDGNGPPRHTTCYGCPEVTEAVGKPKEKEQRFTEVFTSSHIWSYPYLYPGILSLSPTDPSPHIFRLPAPCPVFVLASELWSASSLPISTTTASSPTSGVMD